MAKRVRGPEHPETADALNNLGLLFKKTGDYAKAEPLYQEALRDLLQIGASAYFRIYLTFHVRGHRDE